MSTLTREMVEGLRDDGKCVPPDLTPENVDALCDAALAGLEAQTESPAQAAGISVETPALSGAGPAAGDPAETAEAKELRALAEYGDLRPYQRERNLLERAATLLESRQEDAARLDATLQSIRALISAWRSNDASSIEVFQRMDKLIDAAIDAARKEQP